MKKHISLYRQYIQCFLLAFTILILQSCKKDWLDAKPDKSLVVPTTLQDFQAILDNTDVFNTNYPGLNEVSSDNYYVTFGNWQNSGSALERNSYTWSKELYAGETYNADWNNSYKRILYTNIAIEGVNKITSTNQNLNDWNNVKGTALFYRAFSYYNLSQLFCKPYEEISSTTDLGLPLRLSSDVNAKLQRSSIRETYDQILKDLNVAIGLLPESQIYLTRPSKNAVYALLARVYLGMRDYDKALEYAKLSLNKNSFLIDYNTLQEADNLSFPRFNGEVIFHSEASNYTIIYRSNFNVDTTLYRTYQNNDLRKSLFYTVSGADAIFRGNYSGSNAFFNGLAVDEIMLIRAECYARKNMVNRAMEDINTLLKTRWKKNSDGTSEYNELTASNSLEALKIILEERRKELPFRELRWTDLRRLNSDPNYAITIKRKINNQVYALSPNDPKYTLSIPPDEINLSDIVQNKRD